MSDNRRSGGFAHALQAWQEVDLLSLQKALDAQGLELKAEQKQSLADRKDLAVKTREFKKLEDAEKLQQMQLLLKLYQNTIDSLSAKQKKAEGYFFGFYRAIAEAPDPRPLLEHSLDAVADQSDNVGLRAKVASQSEELARKADYEILKQRLLHNEQKAAETLAARLKAKEEEFTVLLDEKEKNWETLKTQHDRQIATYKETIEELRTSNEVTALQLNSRNLQVGSAEEGVLAAVLAELDIATRDLETWKRRVMELERRNEDLRRELAKEQLTAGSTELQAKFDAQLAEMDGSNALLMASLDQTKSAMAQLRDENTAKIATLRREISSLEQEIKSLKANLARTADYDEIKHELVLLRQIEFGDEIDVGQGTGDSSLNTLVVESNKALTKELAELRARDQSLHEQIQSLSTQVSQAEAEAQSLRELNARIEQDLEAVRDTQAPAFNDTASLVSIVTKQSQRNGPGAEEQLILPIITKQRDRFREKNKELEDEVRRCNSKVAELQRRNKSLQVDNENLYEKTRYMAAMSGGSETKSRGNLRPKANVDLENPYRSAYESRLHPLEQFRQREQDRVNLKLSPFERLFIFVTRLILATRATRMLFLGYCVLLHCLVMFTTIHAMNMNTRLIPEVGLNHSTGGVAELLPNLGA